MTLLKRLRIAQRQANGGHCFAALETLTRHGLMVVIDRDCFGVGVLRTVEIWAGAYGKHCGEAVTLRAALKLAIRRALEWGAE